MTDKMNAGAPVIAVVGSKPDPLLPPEIDTMVFCNGSIYLMDQPGPTPRKIWHFLTNYVRHQRPAHARLERSEMVRTKIKGRRVDVLVELTTLPETELQFSYDDLGYAFGEKIPLSNADRGALTFGYFDWRLPFDILWAPCSVREKASIFGNIFWRKKKPAASTGLVSLLSVIQHLNTGKEIFVLCGVGLASDGYGFSKTPVARGHVCIDYCVFRALSRAQRTAQVFVTDKALARGVGLPLFDGAKPL